MAGLIKRVLSAALFELRSKSENPQTPLSIQLNGCWTSSTAAARTVALA